MHSILFNLGQSIVMLPITTEENDAYEVVERVQREGKINYIILVFNFLYCVS